MRRIFNDMVVGNFAIAVLAAHIGLSYLFFGKTVAIIYGIIQLLIGAWLAYELIRAPVYDD